MSNPRKAKGDRAELEAATLIADLIGVPVRRKLGAGRADDTGDLDGVPDHVIQVANWTDVTAAISTKPDGAETQRANAGAGYAATFLRLRGGKWRVVLTPQQWAAYYQATEQQTNRKDRP